MSNERQMLELSRKAFLNLERNFLGRDPELGYFYRDELVANIDKVLARMPTEQANVIALTRAFMEETCGPMAESDDKDSRLEKYGLAFAAIDYVLSHHPFVAARVPTSAKEDEELAAATKQTYYDDVPIRTVAEAERFCCVPEYHQLKCSNCGRVIERDESIEYRYQADCGDGCGGQMMGTGWAGWYNHWRDLAHELLSGIEQPSTSDVLKSPERETSARPETKSSVPTPAPDAGKFALSGQCDNDAHSHCPYPNRCRCVCHATPDYVNAMGNPCRECGGPYYHLKTCRTGAIVRDSEREIFALPPDVQPDDVAVAERDKVEGQIYVASRASVPERGAMWRKFRAEGVNITSSWIDEDGPGETGDWRELWERISNEISDSNALVLYAENDDFPLKGALIEAGIALGIGIPIVLCMPGVMLNHAWRPIGSWVNHPLVSRVDEIQAAVTLALQQPALAASRAEVRQEVWSKAMALLDTIKVSRLLDNRDYEPRTAAHYKMDVKRALEAAKRDEVEGEK